MAPVSKSRSLLGLAAFGALTAGAAFFGSRFGPNRARTRLWYNHLDKPSFMPPRYVFPIVWGSLYTAMAISGWRVWSAAPSRERNRALALWSSQLAANAKWTELFFGRHRPDLALADVLALETMILSYIKAARKVDPVAARVLVPYAAWIAFASVLNAEIARRNPDAEEMLPAAA